MALTKYPFAFNTAPATIPRAVITSFDGKAWNGSAMEAYVSANYATYSIALTQLGTSRTWVLTVPASLPAGSYLVTGSTPVVSGTPVEATDTPTHNGQLDWNGTDIVNQTGDIFAALPANFEDLDIEAVTGKVTADIVFSQDNIDDISDAVVAGIGSAETDTNLEPVPQSRTFKLVPTADRGLIAEQSKSMMVGYQTTIAVDFASDTTANALIKTVNDVILLAGTGLTITDWGRDDSRAKFRVEATAAGTYEIETEVTYLGGSGSKGRITIVVPTPQTEFEGGVPGSSAEVDWTDADQEPVPADRTFVMVATNNSGLVASVVRSIFAGMPAARFAADFRNDLSGNGRVATVSSVQLVEGDSDGITIGETFGRDRTQAKFTLAGVTAGTYIFNVAGVYASGDGFRGQFTVEVVA